jgi:hypothetical protein
LNPLQEARDSMDRVLSKADDLETFAKQFGTTSGNLLKLEAVAQAKGLDADNLRQLLIKYQGAITDAKANPTAPTPVAAFVNDKDIAESFFRFIQSMQTLTDVQQDYVQRTIFGEKQILKASSFFKATDFKEIIDGLAINAFDFTPQIKNAAAQKGRKDLLISATDTHSFAEQAGKITGGMVDSQVQGYYAAKQQETKLFNDYAALQRLQNQGDELKRTLENGFTMLAKYLPDIIDGIRSVAKSRFVRDMLGTKKGD